MKKGAVFGILILGLFLFSVLNANLILSGSCPSDAICVEASKCENCAGFVAKTTQSNPYCSNSEERYNLDYKIYCKPSVNNCLQICRSDCTSTLLSKQSCQSGDENYHPPSTPTCDSQRNTRCITTAPAMCGTWSFTGCTGTTNCNNVLPGGSCPSGTSCNSSTFGRCIALPNCTLSNCQTGQCGNWSYPGMCLGSVNCSLINSTAFPPVSNGCIIGGTCNSSTNGTCVYRNYQCFKNSTYSIWHNGTQTQTVTNCSRYYSANVSTCCPTGKTCNFSSGSCVDGSRINLCRDYLTRSACEADDMSVARNSVNNSQSCGFSQVIDGCTARINCNCVWQGNSCIGQKNIVQQCPSGSVNASNCTWFPVELQNQACTDPSKPIVARFRAEFKPGSLNNQALRAECVDIVREYPCVSTEKLPFFGGLNFILSIVSIAVLYFVFFRKK